MKQGLPSIMALPKTPIVHCHKKRIDCNAYLIDPCEGCRFAQNTDYVQDCNEDCPEIEKGCSAYHKGKKCLFAQKEEK